jgi:hypothetical protein
MQQREREREERTWSIEGLTRLDLDTLTNAVQYYLEDLERRYPKHGGNNGVTRPKSIDDKIRRFVRLGNMMIAEFHGNPFGGSITMSDS